MPKYDHERTLKILFLILQGYSDKAIAELFGVAPGTVGKIITRAAARQGFVGRMELIRWYIVSHPQIVKVLFNDAKARHYVKVVSHLKPPQGFLLQYTMTTNIQITHHQASTLLHVRERVVQRYWAQIAKQLHVRTRQDVIVQTLLYNAYIHRH